jgi:hypothetical protein
MVKKRKSRQKAPNPEWRFTAEIMEGFYVIAVYRGERCYAEQYFKENPFTIFDKFDFLKGMFK